MQKQNKIYAEGGSDSGKTEETLSSKGDSDTLPETPTQSPARSPSLGSLSSIPSIESKKELSSNQIISMENRIKNCSDEQREVRSFRQQLSKLKSKDNNLNDLGYQKTIHKHPILDLSVRKAEKLNHLIESIEKAEFLLKGKRASPVVRQLKKEIRKIKQLIVL
jgi:hypothetical protein